MIILGVCFYVYVFIVDVVVAHVEGIGVTLGHLLLQLLVREAQ